MEVWVEYRIEVYCDDASTRSEEHRRRRVTIVKFFYDTTDDCWYSQGEASPHMREAADGIITAHQADECRRTGVRRFGIKAGEANAVVRAAGITEHPHKKDWGTGLTYVMSCKLCGLDVSRNEAAVGEVLDVLRASGIHEITLRQLQQRVGAT